MSAPRLGTENAVARLWYCPGGEHASNHIADHIDTVADRRPPDMAVQQRLGILSLQRARPGPDHRFGACANGKNLDFPARASARG